MLIPTLLFGMAGVAFAANGLNVGAVNLRSTYNCISIEAAYSGDDDGDATVSIEYKPSSSTGAWHRAYDAFIDRRASMGSRDNAAHYKQGRVSIVGLVENRSYDVRVAWSDPDGVSGANPTVVSVFTRADVPPLGGGIIYADSGASAGGDGSIENPFNNLADAIARSQPGDTVDMKGSFGRTTISKSGSPGAWIKFQKNGNSACSIGTGTEALLISGDYLWFADFTIAPTSNRGVVVYGTSKYVVLENLDFPEVAAAASPSYGACGVFIAAGASCITVKSCRIHTSNTSGGDDGHGNIAGAIYFAGDGNPDGGHVIASNMITGTFRDGIGGGGNFIGDGPVANSDICYNVINGVRDDGIECEGDNINVRIWGNTITNTTGQSGLGLAGTGIGPLYVFRNTIFTRNCPSVKLGNNSPGPAYFFHNTFVATGSGTVDSLSDVGGDPKSDFHYYRNNIFSPTRYVIYRGGRSNSYDYNLYASNAWLVDEWNGGQAYQNFAAFRTATSQEQNGTQSSSPGFISGTMFIGTNSPAVDRGVILMNFNDPTSAWPFSGANPDIGNREVEGTFTLLPVSPSHLRLSE